jgi:hypothetical protein
VRLAAERVFICLIDCHEPIVILAGSGHRLGITSSPTDKALESATNTCRSCSSAGWLLLAQSPEGGSKLLSVSGVAMTSVTFPLILSYAALSFRVPLQLFHDSY